jgi:hypothetical protein
VTALPFLICVGVCLDAAAATGVVKIKSTKKYFGFFLGAVSGGKGHKKKSTSVSFFIFLDECGIWSRRPDVNGALHRSPALTRPRSTLVF